MQHAQPPVHIIGAGPAGITAGYALAKRGVPVVVHEAGGQVGGMAGSLDLWGQRVDFGPHRFFSNDRRVNELWLEVVGADYQMVSRLTRIFYSGQFYSYPLRAFNALRNLGLWRAADCVQSYLREKISPSPQPASASFESWVVSRFGRRLFDIFFKSYSEKLWGISCQELDADFASQRIKRFSLGEAMKSLLGIAGRHKTLVDRFAFPLAGSGVAYERMAAAIRSRGGEVRLHSAVKGVWREGRDVLGIIDSEGRQAPAAHVVSTMPVNLMVRSLGDIPPEVGEAVSGLRFRHTILVYLEAEGGGWFPDQWLYIHSPELRAGRVTNYRNWAPSICGRSPHSILAMEYWCYDEDAIWKEDDESLVARARAELSKTGLVPAEKINRGHVVRLARCYPVYTRGYKEKLEPVAAFLRSFRGLSVIGRYGAFKYNNQDHSILMGLLAAENIACGTHHDLWAVNTDYDSYQESAIITESGLLEIKR